ncbi:hypothetical protein [Streptomyces sp. NPDC003943]
MGCFRTAALATTALLAAAVPAAAPHAWAEEPTPSNRTVTQEPGHPTILYPHRGGTAAAYCPEGTTPSGGGATVESDPESAVFLKDSFPDGRRWVVRAFNESEEVQTLHPRVICTTDAITQLVGPDMPLEPGEPNNPSEISCGNDRFVVGGGAAAGDRTYLSATDSSDIRAWHARAKYTNFDPAAPLSYVRAFATCSDKEPTYKFSDTVKLEAGHVGVAHAECPAGLVPTGGGGSGGLDVLFNSSSPTATGWTVRATNTGFGQLSLYASVVCGAP